MVLCNVPPPTLNEDSFQYLVVTVASYVRILQTLQERLRYPSLGTWVIAVRRSQKTQRAKMLIYMYMYQGATKTNLVNQIGS